MVQAATLISEFVAGRTFENLLHDKLFQSAVERQFEILGEACTHVSKVTKQQWPTIDWQGVKDFRNVIAHEYFRTDYAELWYIAHHVVPPLLLMLREVFESLDREFGPDAPSV
ncbi:hypothetical protein BEN47_04555 [Hymenobacter lapidarius]|uniref:DUF86 domain-containing protein n=2 Tax=Hymenobacter lapidarius TaxID=1908237 RepID=A0A1G1SVM9_9BACT|nr:hypothetical protein BEN47_04555 [Hymenobacter lapidarius]